MTLGFGCASLGNLFRATTDENALDTLNAAWDGGIRLYDAAPYYGCGLAEKRLGQFLANKMRADYVLSTKVGRVTVPNDTTDPRAHHPEFFADISHEDKVINDYSRDGVMRSVEQSLRRLGVDHFDVLHVHDPDIPERFGVAMKEAFPTLHQLKAEGVVRKVGCGSNFLSTLIPVVRDADVDVIMMSGLYTLLTRNANEELLPLCLAKGVEVMAVSVFNSGILANPNREQVTYNYAPAEDYVIELAKHLQEMCRAHGIELAAAALKFPLRHPAIESVLFGSQWKRNVLRNLDAFGSEVPNDLWGELEAEVSRYDLPTFGGTT